MSNIRLTVDTAAQAAYITLYAGEVASTEEVSDAVMVDLDAMRVVVGVEVLALSAEIPFSKLHADYHVHSDAIDALRAIQPTVSGFLSLTQSTDGVAAAPAEQLVSGSA
jgi:uncharacterized protein YuzE